MRFWSSFLPKLGFGKNCRCGLVLWVVFSEPVGTVSCGAGSMLLLAITIHRDRIQSASPH